MSTEKIDEQLIKFLQQHPEFFTGKAGEQSIRQDLLDAVRNYARALDPAAYERLSQRVLAFQVYSRGRLKERIAELVQEKERHSLELRKVEVEFEAFELKIKELHQELAQYRTERNGSAVDGGNNWNRDLLSFSIDIIGIGFLYAGFILSEYINYSLVVFGGGFFAAGFWLHRGARGKSVASVSHSDSLSLKIQSRLDELQQVWKMKKLSLLERKKESVSKIELIDQEIRRHLNRMTINS